MPFHIDRREIEGVGVVAPNGRLTLGAALEQFRDALDAQFNAGRTLVVLDFTHVDYIDSSALGALVVAHTRFEKAGGGLTMYGLNQRNLELMVITKLATVFRIANHEMEAMNLLFPDRATRSFDILNFVEDQRAQKKDGDSQ